MSDISVLIRAESLQQLVFFITKVSAKLCSRTKKCAIHIFLLKRGTPAPRYIWGHKQPRGTKNLRSPPKARVPWNLPKVLPPPPNPPLVVFTTLTLGSIKAYINVYLNES